ncbi:MAG: hypothetical protein AAF141_09200 [Pseudomonadota bacterium]
MPEAIIARLGEIEVRMGRGEKDAAAARAAQDVRTVQRGYARLTVENMPSGGE